MDSEPATARSPAGFALLATLLAAGAHMALWYPRLPERLASHFEVSGQANGWMSRDGFLLMYAGVVVLIGAVFAALALVLPRIPDELINVPYKHYWLATSRRGATLAWLGRWMLWVGAGTVAFIIMVMQLTFAANVGAANLGVGEPSLGNEFWFVFGGFMAMMLGALAWLMLRLSREPGAAGPPAHGSRHS